MKITLNEAYSDESILTCPSCGGDNLCQDTVEVFTKEKHVSVISNGWSNSDTDMTDAPRCGSVGLLIHFNCEHCKAKPVLAFSHYSGETRLQIGYIPNAIKWD